MHKREVNEFAYLTEQYTSAQLRNVLLPFGRFRTFWDLFTLVFVLCASFVIGSTLSITIGFSRGFISLHVESRIRCLI